MSTCPAQAHGESSPDPRRIIQALSWPVAYNNPLNASGRRQKRQKSAALAKPAGLGSALRLPGQAPCPHTISARPGSMSTPRSAAGAAVALDRDQANYLRQRAAARARRRGAAVQRPRRRMAGAACRRRQADAQPPSRRANAARSRGRRPAFPVRPAQARAARLSGAEGGGDGRLAAAAGDHPAHASRARQSRAHARQRDRGGAAMRHSQSARGRRAGRFRRADGGLDRPTGCWCSATRTPR